MIAAALTALAIPALADSDNGTLRQGGGLEGHTLFAATGVGIGVGLGDWRYQYSAGHPPPPGHNLLLQSGGKILLNGGGNLLCNDC